MRVSSNASEWMIAYDLSVECLGLSLQCVVWVSWLQAQTGVNVGQNVSVWYQWNARLVWGRVKRQYWAKYNSDTTLDRNPGCRQIMAR